MIPPRASGRPSDGAAPENDNGNAGGSESGGGADALSGAATLRRMVDAAGDALLIAAGGGLTEQNVADLVRATGVREVHGSLRHAVPSAMRYRRDPPVYMGAEKLNRPEVEFEVRVTQREKVAAVVTALGTAGGAAADPERAR